MKRYNLMVHSPDIKGYWKNGQYKSVKAAKKVYKQIRSILNLDKAKIINKTTKSVSFI